MSAENNLKTACTSLRGNIAIVLTKLKEVRNSEELFKSLPKDSDTGELVPNLILAFRHLEDARMRLGKVIQAYEGGRSNNP